MLGLSANVNCLTAVLFTTGYDVIPEDLSLLHNNEFYNFMITAYVMLISSSSSRALWI